MGIVNASQFQKPILLGQFDLTGEATDVAVDSNLRIAAVAANAGGLHFVNVADPMQPALLQTINLNARQVEVIGGVAYVAAGGDLWSFDLASRALLQQLPLGGAALTGLASEGLFLYTINTSRVLRAIDLRDGTMTPRGSLTMPAGGGKIFVGNGVAYVSAGAGFATANVADPGQLQLLSGVDAANIEGSAVVANGSGLAIAVGSVTGPSGPIRALDVLNVSDPGNTAAFVTRFNLSATPFSVAVGAGIAFVADGTAGLQVVNYRSFDNQGVPPTLTLSNSFAMTSATNGVAEEGKLALLSARTTDDVQVRNVEFYVDGVKVFSDASFPFEHRFLTPRLTATKTNFVVQAKATDTGGNFAWTDTIVVALTPDATPPRVLGTLPPSPSVITQATDTVIVYFNEPMDANTLNAASFRIISAGPDTRLGTADDVPLSTGSVSYRDTLNAAVITFPAPLPFGIYRILVTATVTDAAGNHLTNDFSSTFAYFATGPDGDDDGDDVTNSEELQRGTNPFLADTDGDGWNDRAEIDDGTDPLNPNSRPMMTFVARPPVLIDLPSPEAFGSAGVGTFVARPPVLIDLLSPDRSGEAGFATFIARPSVEVCIPSPETFGTAGVGTFIGWPPVLIDLPSPAVAGTEGAPTIVARPPVLIDLPGLDGTSFGGLGLFLARPPVSIIITNSPAPGP